MLCLKKEGVKTSEIAKELNINHDVCRSIINNMISGRRKKPGEDKKIGAQLKLKQEHLN